jgi:hypothetical protein
MAGQVAPTSAAGVVVAPYATYVPSPIEIAIVVGAGAFVALGYTLSERYLDLNESDAHASFPGPALLAWLRRRFATTEQPAEVPG